MIRQWNEFEGKPNRTGTDQARVTINKKGMLSMNGVGFRAIEGSQVVKLLFGGNNQTIGLKPVDAKSPNAFPVKPKDKWGNRMIFASPFAGITITQHLSLSDSPFLRAG